MRSCAVIGLPDEDKGNRVHAIVEADPSTVTTEELSRSWRERLSIYKVPRTVELVDEPLRDDAGKVRRAALRAERLPGLTDDAQTAVVGGVLAHEGEPLEDRPGRRTPRGPGGGSPRRRPAAGRRRPPRSSPGR